MSNSVNLLIALQALRVNKLRSVLTMLGIVIGVAAVIAMIAIGGGAQQRVQEQIASLGSNLLIVIPGSVIQSGARLGLGNAQTLTESDYKAIQMEIPEVQVAAPVSRGNAQVIYGNTNWATSINGVYNDYFEAREWNLSEGRFFDQGEITRFGKVAIIGKTVASQLFGEDTPIGEVVRIRGIPFEIIGVADGKGQSGMGQDQDDVIFYHLATGDALLQALDGFLSGSAGTDHAGTQEFQPLVHAGAAGRREFDHANPGVDTSRVGDGRRDVKVQMGQ